MRTSVRIAGYAVLGINGLRALILLFSGLGLLLGYTQTNSGALRDATGVMLSFLGAGQLIYAILLLGIVYGLLQHKRWAWYALLTISVIEIFRIFDLAFYSFVALAQVYLLLFESVFTSAGGSSGNDQLVTPETGVDEERQ